MLTPHQFESVAQYVDTLLVSTYTPSALDIAAPYVASELIANQLITLVSGQFRGRVTTMHAGSTNAQWFLHEDWVRTLTDTWMHPVKHGIVVTDRTLLGDTWLFSTSTNTTWLVFDWWQWLRRRVPQNRLCDAFMFLCHSCPGYWDSEERKRLGMEPALSESMKMEGTRLMDTMVTALVDEVLQMWASGAKA